MERSIVVMSYVEGVTVKEYLDKSKNIIDFPFFYIF